MRALALIDGEHYPPVVRDALSALPYEFACCVNVGGGEKLRLGSEQDDAVYGVPLIDSIEQGIESYSPEIVVDLSDEPVLGARICAQHFEVVVVAMGRGGPPEPELRETPPSIEELLELARMGRHAASDYLEDAVLGEIVSVGARRCGGGLAGAVGYSNVAEAAEMALERHPDLVVFEGSGAALPPIATDRRVLVVSAHQDAELACGYLNTYRILVSDLVVLTFAEPGERLDQLRGALASLRPELPVIATTMKPRPLVPVAGKKTALFTTAPELALPSLAEHLESAYGAEVVHVSGNLARRKELRSELETIEAELFLVELKAAAVDVVVKEAMARGCEVAVVDNELFTLAGEPDLDSALLRLGEQARAKEPVG